MLCAWIPLYMLQRCILRPIVYSLSSNGSGNVVVPYKFFFLKSYNFNYQMVELNYNDTTLSFKPKLASIEGHNIYKVYIGNLLATRNVSDAAKDINQYIKSLRIQ